MSLSSWQPSSNAVPRISIVAYLSLAIVSGLGLLGKIQLLQRVYPFAAWVWIAAVAGALLLPILWPVALTFRRFTFCMVLLGILVASLGVYPRIRQLQRFGRGSDQSDCLIVAADSMVSAEWPYDRAKMWSRTPMSCGAGWVIFQTPAIELLGYRWNLVLQWILALALLRLSLSWKAIAGSIALLGLAPGTWIAACDGTDFLYFGVLLAGVYLALQKEDELHPVPLLMLIVLAQFRFPMLILPALILGTAQRMRAIAAVVVAFAVHLFFLLWRPAAYIEDGPLHLFYKVARLSLATSRGPAVIELVLISTVMGVAAFWLRSRIRSQWLVPTYLVMLTIPPALLNLLQLSIRHGSLLAGLGLWEGPNWLTGCLPFSSFLLLASVDQLKRNGAPLLTPLRDLSGAPQEQTAAGVV